MKRIDTIDHFRSFSLAGYLSARRKAFVENFYIILFVGPSLLMVSLVLVFPLLFAVYLSFNEYAGKELVFVGLSNYRKAFFDPTTWTSLWITIRYTVLSVCLSCLIGLILALVLEKQRFAKRFLRTVFTLPWPILSVVVGVAFLWMVNPQFGMFNELLVRLRLIDAYRAWLSDGRSATVVVIFATVWKEAPFFMIMITAALQAIPREQYEAAAVDGASYLQELFFITLPNLKRILLITFMLQVIWRFRTFDLVNVITEGGPSRTTEVLAVNVYRYAFVFAEFGKGSAIAILMAAFSLVLVLIYLRILRSTESDE